MKGADGELENGYQITAEVVRIRTNVSNDEVLGLKFLLFVGVAVYEGFVIRFDILQQFLIRVILDATIVEPWKRHAVKRRRSFRSRTLASAVEILRLGLNGKQVWTSRGGLSEAIFITFIPEASPEPSSYCSRYRWLLPHSMWSLCAKLVSAPPRWGTQKRAPRLFSGCHPTSFQPYATQGNIHMLEKPRPQSSQAR